MKIIPNRFFIWINAKNFNYIIYKTSLRFSVYQRESVFDIPDKSWSVLYFGSGKDSSSK